MLKIIIVLNFFLTSCKSCHGIRDELCIYCNRKTKNCNRCMKSYVNAEGICQKSEKQIQHCLEYEEEGKCKYCQMGFYTNSYGKCIKIQKEDCLELRDAENCSICKDGILVTDGSCKTKNKCATQNCQYCGRDLKTNNEICMLCDDKYALIIVDNKINCIFENEGQKNCMYLSSIDNEDCQECDMNFYSFEGQCYQSTQYTAELEMTYLTSVTLVAFAIVFN